MQALQSRLWTLSPWTPNMKLDLYIDASALGFGAILLRDGKSVVLYRISNSHAYHHFSTAKLEGLVLALRTFKHFLINYSFTIYTDYWVVLHVVKGLSQKAYVLRRQLEIMTWFPHVNFVEGSQNLLVDGLSQFSLFPSPTDPVPLSMVHYHTQNLFSSNDCVCTVEDVYVVKGGLLNYLQWSGNKCNCS